MTLRNDPGFIASSAVHGAALVVMMLHFSQAPTFDEAQESVAVETITTSELNQIMNGEKTAKQMPVPQRRVDKVAELTEAKPLPPLAEAKKDVPQAAPEKPRDDPGDADKPLPTPPERTASLPPPTPEPTPPVKSEDTPVPPRRPAPEPAKAEQPKAEPPKPVVEKPVVEKPVVEKPAPEDAEATEPKPVPRPKVEPKKEAKTEPKPVAKPIAKPEKKPPPKVAKVPDPPKKVEPHFKPDELAKLLADPKPAAKPKAGNEAKDAQTHTFNAASISALLDHDAPQRKAATGQRLTQVASLGLPTTHATAISPSMLGQISEYFQGQYLSCWTYYGLASADAYVPVVYVRLMPDGTLVGQPVLRNQPSDPNQKSLADSALRAVQKCNPMKIPDRFSPYFDTWHEQVIKFDRKALL